MDVFEKIAAQQGAERTAVWVVGEQLKDIIRDDPRLHELVDKDLDVAAMSLAECEKKIKAYADDHRAGNFACVSPIEAEEIIREFYGLGKTTGDKPQSGGKVLNLEDFF